jgi:hypothetical protein
MNDEPTRQDDLKRAHVPSTCHDTPSARTATPQNAPCGQPARFNVTHLDCAYLANARWIARLTALQEARALRWLEREAGIPGAFFDTRPAATTTNHNGGKPA